MPCHSGGGATKKSARPVATRRADGGCGRSLRWSSSKMQRHRLPPPALISPPKPRLQTLQYLCSSVLSVLGCAFGWWMLEVGPISAGHYLLAIEATDTEEIIVCTGLRPANWDLYLFNSPGGAPRALTNDPDLDYNPAFSPDGRWIVFCSERRGNPDLYVLDLQHPGKARPLTDSDALEDAAAFSPDGRQLAFVSTREGNADIYVMPFRPAGSRSIGPSSKPHSPP